MSRDSIKMVAMLTMLINHIANVFLPAGQPLTNLCLCIGYFTAVTMCYFLVEGAGEIPAAALTYMPWKDRSGEPARRPTHGYLPEENANQCSVCHG